MQADDGAVISLTFTYLIALFCRSCLPRRSEGRPRARSHWAQRFATTSEPLLLFAGSDRKHPVPASQPNLLDRSLLTRNMWRMGIAPNSSRGEVKHGDDFNRRLPVRRGALRVHGRSSFRGELPLPRLSASLRRALYGKYRCAQPRAENDWRAQILRR